MNTLLQNQIATRRKILARDDLTPAQRDYWLRSLLHCLYFV